ncbi:hypothetical protein [Candidatus Solirubrobacter pratensis]|uniref:hypothetical protein n=1 Tax=Candidatus Solirubrobacter pratensis TaxID=1298857 RepID=UPI0004182E20|nr:hypothetical protein [Candidatus Solirubrobacter pratensis]
MPGGLSLKITAVVAAFAFVGAFRIHAGSGGETAGAATTLSPAGAGALAADTSTAPAPRGIAVPALSRVAALPALHRAPARPHRRAKAPVRHVATATATPTPAATVVRTVPTAPPRRPQSYVGKSFDSEG